MSEFDRMARGEPANLVRAALEIARDEFADLDMPTYLEQIELMTEGFDVFVGANRAPEAVLDDLCRFFFEELGFAGNSTHYYDPRNSYLNEVIDRRTGIPISLGILFKQLASNAGIELEAINFPGHFLLAHRTGPFRRRYLDVFDAGRLLDWAECLSRFRPSLEKGVGEHDFEAMSDASVLTRSLRNLKSIYAATDVVRCLRVQKRLARLLPRDLNEMRDLGVLYFHAGRPAEAVATLRELIQRDPRWNEDQATADYLRRSFRESALLN